MSHIGLDRANVHAANFLEPDLSGTNAPIARVALPKSKHVVIDSHELSRDNRD